MQVFGVLPDLTLLHVVPFGVLETLLHVLLDILKGRILVIIELPFDVIESHRSFDDRVVVGILSF